MGATPERLAQISRAIADGSYAPAAEAVAESVLGWTVSPASFERPAGPDRFKSPDGTAEGPLDRTPARGDTAAADT